MSQVGGKAFDFKLFLKVMAYADPIERFYFRRFFNHSLGWVRDGSPHPHSQRY